MVPIIGLTARRDADITAGIKVSASYTRLIRVVYSGHKEYPTTPHTLSIFKCPYMVVPLFHVLLLVCGLSCTPCRDKHDWIPRPSPISSGYYPFCGVTNLLSR